MMKHNILTAIDLFAGAGGLSLAALKSGVAVRAAVENDPHAVETYTQNILPRSASAIEVFAGDIRQMNWRALLKQAQLVPGECDILLGGPPCQGFSTHRIKGAGVGDPRNRLLLSYFESLRIIRPRSFLVENVTGLLWPRHAAHLKAFLKGCRESGYLVFDPIILNARDYGVPQNRKRVFILGLRKDIDAAICWPPEPTHFDPNSDAVRRDDKRAWRTSFEVFSLPLPPGDPNAVHMNHTDELRRVFQSTPRNGGSRLQSNRLLPCHAKHDGHKDVYGRIDPKKPGPTMTTGCVNPSKGRFVHPTANHAITARHAARFQSFPDDFMFSGGLMAAGKQIGNAVPIQLGEIIITAIATSLRATRQSRSMVA
jgi:DNA (cytosine-5)-methyltransferase 1